MKPWFKFLLIILVGLTANAVAAPLCPPELAKLPVQAGGRVKPLGVHAKEVIKFLTGKTHVKNKNSLTIYCEMSLGIDHGQDLFLKVEHKKSQAFLQTTEDGLSSQMAMGKLPQASEYAQLLEARNDKSPHAKDIKNFVQRVRLYQNVVGGHDWNVPVLLRQDHPDDTQNNKNSNNNIHWFSLNELKQVFPEDLKTPRDVVFAALVAGTKYTQEIDNRHLLEWRYEQSHLFNWAILASILALTCVFVFKRPLALATGLSLSLIYVVEITAIVCRSFISHRAPVTNMYETVMWVGLGSLTFATILTAIRREKIFIGAGLLLNLSCLFMMSLASNMLNPSIGPLVPVLRDNFWLSTHVTMVTVSYAAFALSWFIANYFMIVSAVKGVDPARRDRLNFLAYDCVKIGVVLLSLGVILGGIWADYSWGRFWGWDPKETWALIALLTYIAILHGRYAGWITANKFLPAVGVAFLTILMAWFGVNYILATGLHSYGFSNNGAVFITTVVVVQMLIFTVCLWQRRRKKVS